MLFETTPSLFMKNVHRGYCVGFGVSLKTFTIKYLLCAFDNTTLQPEFSLKFSTATRIEQDKIHIHNLRPVLPKSCVKIFLNTPIYTQTGVFCGNLNKIETDSDTSVRLFTEKCDFSISEVYACADAIIIKKPQPYPLGQRIPARAPQNVLQTNTGLVTKPVLRSAIQTQSLIKFTLSLAPFSVEN